MTRMFHALVVCSLVAVAAGPVSADGGETVEQRLERMQSELRSLRDDNQSLRQELDDLRATTDEDWLTERRAEEIRTIVGEVLADADVRGSLLEDGLTAGWSDHFFLASADGRFKLQLDGQVQTRFIWNYHESPDRYVWGFENSRTKLTFRGHVFTPDISYLVRTAVAQNENVNGIPNGSVFLEDAWVRINLSDDWALRIGQFKLPFLREELVYSSNQLAVERSLAAENLSIGRSEGAELSWLDDHQRFSIAISDGAQDQFASGALLMARPMNQPVIGQPSFMSPDGTITDTEYAITARYESLLAGQWNQFADFTSPPGDDYGALLGFAGHWQRSESGNPFAVMRDETDWVAGTADLSLEFGGASAFAAVTVHYLDTPGFNVSMYSVVAQASTYVTPKLEWFARFEYGWWKFSGSSLADLTLATLGANYYLDGHDLKWTTDLSVGISKIESSWRAPNTGFRTEADGDEPQIVLRTQFQLLF